MKYALGVAGSILNTVTGWPDEPGFDSRSVVAAVQLIVGGHVAFAGVGAWHEIRAWRRRLDLEHGDGLAGRARVRLGPGQSVERLTGRRDVAGVQEPQHVIE